MKPRAHAEHAPSSSERWLKCPGSIKLSRGLSTSSPAAREGTFAHWIAHRCLIDRTPASKLKNRNSHAIEFLQTVDQEERPLFEADQPFVCDEGMIDAVDFYIERVRSFPAEVAFYESKVRLRDVPEVYGSLDYALRDTVGRLHVFDFKYGSGVFVDPKRNSQLSIYAAASMHGIPMLSGPVLLHIIQPRHHRGGHLFWETSIPALEAFVEQEVKPAVALSKTDNPPLVAGDHCEFCPARSRCPELRRASLAAVGDLFEGDVEAMIPATTPPTVGTMSAEQLAAIMRATPMVEKWLAAVHEEAYSRARAGRVVPGYKLVGKFGNRVWRNKDEARATLGMILPDSSIMDQPEPSLRSPAQIEKLLPRGSAEKLMASLTEKPSRGTVLAPVDEDDRPAIDPADVFNDGFNPAG